MSHTSRAMHVHATNYLMYQRLVIVSSAAAALLRVCCAWPSCRFDRRDDVSELEVRAELVNFRPRKKNAHENLVQFVPEHNFPCLRVGQDTLEVH